MEDHTADALEEMVLRMAAKVEARKNGQEQAELVLRATIRETLHSEPMFLELGALVDAYAETIPAVDSRIHPSCPDNPVRGYASTLLDVHAILLKQPQRWCNAEVSEEEACELHHKWFYYMEQCARVIHEWGSADRKTKSRHDFWFESYLLASDDDDRWRYYTRMCRQTFLCISNRLQILSWRESFSSRPVVPIPVQLGATLHHLIHGADGVTISENFGIEISAVQNIIETCVQVLLRALAECLVWPRPIAMQRVISGFKKHWFLDDCRGILGTTRVIVSPPKFNGSVTHLIALQGVCDSTGAFLNISCAHPGTLSDNEILRASNLYDKASRGVILKPAKASGGDEAGSRPYLLASQNYEPLPWLLVSRDSDKDGLDRRFTMARTCIDHAFRDLKRGFRCLRSGILCELSNAPAFIHVCCALHNFLYLKEECRIRPSRSQRLDFPSSGDDSNDEQDESESDWESDADEETHAKNMQGSCPRSCSPCSFFSDASAQSATRTF